MKTIFIICVLGVLVGCGYPVTKADWTAAEEVCHSNEGVQMVSSHDTHTFVYCNNGAEFKLKR